MCFLNSATYSATDLVGFLICQSKLNLWTISLGLGLKWFFNKVNNCSNVFSPSFAGLSHQTVNLCSHHTEQYGLLFIAFIDIIRSKEVLHYFTVFFPSLHLWIKWWQRLLLSPSHLFSPSTRALAPLESNHPIKQPVLPQWPESRAKTQKQSPRLSLTLSITLWPQKNQGGLRKPKNRLLVFLLTHHMQHTRRENHLTCFFYI